MNQKIVTIIALGTVFVAGIVLGAEESRLKTEKDKVSYIIGTQIGIDMKHQGIEVDPDLVAKGIKDALAGQKRLLSEQQASETMAAFHKTMTAKRVELAARNRKEGDAFLTENRKKEGVISLPDGMQYKIIKAGIGKSPKITDTVVVNYRGTFIDGTEFESSYSRGEPAVFPVNGVIKGWSEALQLMKVGSTWQLFIPPQLAYGEQGSPRVGPKATLIFEVELVAIK
jgi:FKBP-type peptidyl-prolyl cis-trans isomerase FklB